MEIFNPPKSYIDFRCYTNGLSGPELSYAHERFYKKHSEYKKEIANCFNWLSNQRILMNLPVEKIEVREQDGKKHGKIIEAMIYDIEYWIEDAQVHQKKVYIPYIPLERR